MTDNRFLGYILYHTSAGLTFHGNGVALTTESNGMHQKLIGGFEHGRGDLLEEHGRKYYKLETEIDGRKAHVLYTAQHHSDKANRDGYLGAGVVVYASDMARDPDLHDKSLRKAAALADEFKKNAAMGDGSHHKNVPLAEEILRNNPRPDSKHSLPELHLTQTVPIKAPEPPRSYVFNKEGHPFIGAALFGGADKDGKSLFHGTGALQGQQNKLFDAAPKGFDLRDGPFFMSIGEAQHNGQATKIAIFTLVNGMKDGVPVGVSLAIPSEHVQGPNGPKLTRDVIPNTLEKMINIAKTGVDQSGKPHGSTDIFKQTFWSQQHHFGHSIASEVQISHGGKLTSMDHFQGIKDPRPPQPSGPGGAPPARPTPDGGGHPPASGSTQGGALKGTDGPRGQAVTQPDAPKQPAQSRAGRAALLAGLATTSVGVFAGSDKVHAAAGPSQEAKKYLSYANDLSQIAGILLKSPLAGLRHFDDDTALGASANNIVKTGILLARNVTEDLSGRVKDVREGVTVRAWTPLPEGTRKAVADLSLLSPAGLVSAAVRTMMVGGGPDPKPDLATPETQRPDADPAAPLPKVPRSIPPSRSM